MMVYRSDSRRPEGRRSSGGVAIKPLNGFTLIELMIVVAIIALIAAIAYPSYIKSVTKTKRSAAEACLSEYANYMERFYTTNLRYDKDSAGNANALPALDCSTGQNTGGDYQYTLPVVTASTFTVTATPIGAQLNRDAQCGALSVDQTGAHTITGTGTVADCW